MRETRAEFRRSARLFSAAGVWCAGWIFVFGIFGFSLATAVQPALNLVFILHVVTMALCGYCCVFLLGYGLLPSLAWNRLVYTLRDPQCIEAITRHGLPAESIVEGVSVRMPAMAWRFSGVVITSSVYQSVLAAIVTTLGVVVATLARNGAAI